MALQTTALAVRPITTPSPSTKTQTVIQAKSKINAHWNYERGRQWASLAPKSMLVKVDGALNPKAVALYEAARNRGYIAR